MGLSSEWTDLRVFITESSRKNGYSGTTSSLCDDQFICFSKGLISLKQESMVMFLRVGKFSFAGVMILCENCRGQ